MTKGECFFLSFFLLSRAGQPSPPTMADPSTPPEPSTASSSGMSAFAPAARLQPWVDRLSSQAGPASAAVVAGAILVSALLVMIGEGRVRFGTAGG